MANYEKTFEDNLIKVMDGYRYMGCLIEKRNGRFYRRNGNSYDTLQQAIEAIDKTFQTIQKSII